MFKRSNFKKVKIGETINLEKSLKYGHKVSGHFVQGHVDTTANVKEISFIDKSWSLTLVIKEKNFRKQMYHN